MAGELGIPETDLTGWLNRDALFVAELNRRRRATWEANAQRLRGLAGRALDAIEVLLDSDDKAVRLRAAATILKALDLAEVGKPTGNTGSGQVEAEWRRQAALTSMMSW